MKTKRCSTCGKTKGVDKFQFLRVGCKGQNLYKSICWRCKTRGKAARRLKNVNDWKVWAGGKCETWGYNKCFAALDFHHRDPANKTDDPGKLIRRVSPFSPKTDKVNKIQSEIRKCDLLCANCHREVHAGYTQ